jgi:alpha,alpha-trehalase
VVNQTHKVFAEYGNVGTEFQYLTKEGFGWMNASFRVGLNYLNKKLKNKLNNLIPPEWIFGN